MPDSSPDNAVAEAALESVAAEVQSKARSHGAADKTGNPADQKVAALEQEIREANDRALRANAELENFRKRSQRELADARRYAIVPRVRDLLPVLDNFERAIESAETQ